MDGAHGWVMAACAEGKVSVVGAQAGAMLGSVTVLGAIDQITYDPVRQRLYAPSATALAMAVISPAAGTPALLGSIATPGGGSCAVSAGGGAVFVCAPAQGSAALRDRSFLAPSSPFAACRVLRSRSMVAMRRRTFAVALLLASLFALAAACSQSTPSAGHGDNIFNDTDGEDIVAPQQGDEMVDEVFARADSPYAPAPDGYAPYNWCSQCACPADTYCFGGGTGFETFSGVCADAAPAGGGLAIGCMPIPSACANEPSCECLIQSVQAEISCSPVCSITNMIVYCPTP